jgi:antitoxin component of RelBE/YafQ-DinJ toxin-antitoxin module
MKTSQQIMDTQTNDQVMATINVRIKKDLKTGGNKVLECEGVSVSDAIRKLYSYLDATQSIPECLKLSDISDSKEVIARKRTTLNSLVGVSALDVSYETLKDQRLKRQLRTGAQ